jgi:DNA-binding CsgD family transcriptional regulator/ArsR family metal-binding transcriptional regulator
MNRVGGFEDNDYSRAYTTLRLFSSGPLSGQAADINCEANAARFEWHGDLSPLFPYINAVVNQSQYYDKPVYIKFMFADRLCALYPDRGAFTPIRDMAEAMDFLPELLGFLADVAHRAPDIVPNHKKYRTSSAVDIYRLLPGSNCRLCGYASCMAFAAALSRRHTDTTRCPHLNRPVEESATFPVYDEQGNLVRTVSMDIDTTALRREIDRQEERIRELQSRLADVDKANNDHFDLANAGLPAPLTGREIQVLRQIVAGATNREMSALLNISVHTVKSHVTSIFNKLGVNDRAQAAAWGAVHGLNRSS